MIGRTNSGAGGSLSATDALLRVQAPAGSTVTITKGSVTKSDAGHENADNHAVYDYYFIIHQSQFDSQTWTVTATSSDQTQTATASVAINAADEYDIYLSYNLEIYNNGIIETEITGGLVAEKAYQSGSINYSLTNENNILTVYSKYASGSSGCGARFGTINAVDLSEYTSLVLVISYSASGSATQQGVGVYSSKSGGSSPANQVSTNAIAYQYIAENISSDTTYTIDLTNINQSCYVDIRTYNGAAATAEKTIYVKEWYLTRA